MPGMAVTAPVELPDGLLAGALGAGPVELRETHISWVFLTRERAYKVKKPVVLPFLDYGTAARRRVCCEAEVAVNRRLAPGVYLGVTGLARRPWGWDLVDANALDAVEHAVVMRRFDEAATLAARLRAGEVHPGTVADIGRLIARFHARAERAAGDLATNELSAVLQETASALQDHDHKGDSSSSRVGETVRFVDAALRGRAAELHQRAASGLPCDGHGDLRAEHVVLEREPVIVDAIEFDPVLRLADPGYDIAFLAMDLARLQPAMVEPLLRGYKEAGGDPGSPLLFAAFVCLRALIRAKVSEIRAQQGAKTAEAEASTYLAVAERLAWQARLGPVTCVAGLSASGKSTLAARLAELTGSDVLSSDRLRKRLAGVDPDERAPGRAYSRARSVELYRRLGDLAAQAGTAVIVDATFRHPDDVAAFSAACDRPVRWIECRAPAAILLERAAVRTRAPEHGSDADATVVRDQLHQFAAAGGLPLPSDRTVLDSNREWRTARPDLAAALDADILRQEA